MKAKIILAFSLVMVLALSACIPGLFGGPAVTPVPTLDPNQLNTAVVQTVGVRQTIAYLETRIGNPTSLPTASPTLSTPSTRTPTPTATLTPTLAPTFTSLPPTITNTPGIPCNKADFVTDVTYPDGTVVSPGQTIIKTWRLKNTGSCGWSSSYALVFASGSQLGGPNTIAMPMGVKPGEMVDLSVTLTAPATNGDFTSYWQLKDPNGATFGTGPRSQPFWAKIKVGATTMSSTSLIDTYCSAVWKSSSGNLGCPAPRVDFSAGSVFRVDNPKLEGGYTDNEPALVMVPNNGSGGKITGTFPAFKVESGDHFVTLWGCMDNTPKCSVTFKLSYTIDGTTVTDLLAWDHNFTGSGGWKSVNIDLSSLAGQSVKFILTVGNHDDSSADDQAFWLNPNIKR